MEINKVTAVVSVLVFILYLGGRLLPVVRQRQRAPISVPGGEKIISGPQSWRVRFFWTPDFLLILALLFLLIAFSRPRSGREVIKTAREGIAIQMVVDRSSSMKEMMKYKSREMDRLSVVKEVFKTFLLGNGETLKGRSNDLVGVTMFSGMVQEVVPLSLDHQSVMRLTDAVQTADRTEDGTMIGDAIYYTSLRLVAAEALLKENRQGETAERYRLHSKVIILLTDGRQTPGGMDPVAAAEFAAEHGIKIYTIAIIEDEKTARAGDPFWGAFFGRANGAVDTTQLEKASALTGGFFQKVKSGEALNRVYQKIDELEKSQFEEHVTAYKEQFSLFVYLGLFCLFIAYPLRWVVFQKIP